MEFIDLQKLVKTDIEKFRKNFVRELKLDSPFPKEIIYMTYNTDSLEELKELNEMLGIFSPEIIYTLPVDLGNITSLFETCKVSPFPDAEQLASELKAKLEKMKYLVHRTGSRMLIAIQPFFTETKFSELKEPIPE